MTRCEICDRPHRINPPGCGCTDCLTAWSKPVDTCTDSELRMLSVDSIQDASTIDWSAVDAAREAAERAAIHAEIDRIRRINETT